MATVPNHYKGTDSPQSSLSHLSPNITTLTGIKNSLHGSSISLFDEMDTEEASGSAPPTSKHDSKTGPKRFVTLILQSSQKDNTKF